MQSVSKDGTLQQQQCLQLQSLQLPEETNKLLRKIEESQTGFGKILQGPFGPRPSKSQTSSNRVCLTNR